MPLWALISLVICGYVKSIVYIQINMHDYIKIRKTDLTPRLPLCGNLDITYRCNNNCRHCWVNIPVESDRIADELTFEEARALVDDARLMGCRSWSFSGGEPMLRDDFVDVFDYITRRSISYSLNTNGTLITPQIARLMKRRGVKLVSIYGADAKVHDHITRTAGSFDSAMQGIARLKEAGAGFTIQIVPMKDNFHQYKQMIHLAKSLSSHWRIGAGWLYLAPEGNPERNREIKRQRLLPEKIIELDPPEIPNDMVQSKRLVHKSRVKGLYYDCVSNRNAFYVNPYGYMSFCPFVRDAEHYYNLRQGSFQEGWERFIPSLAARIKINSEYKENCGACELYRDCHWCPVYAYLEHGRHEAKVEYLCAIAENTREYKEAYRNNHERVYSIAGMSIQVKADLPLTDTTFHPGLEPFVIESSDGDTIVIHHRFRQPDIEHLKPLEIVYERQPWTIYRSKNGWLYRINSSLDRVDPPNYIADVNFDHTKVTIYHNETGKRYFQQGGIKALTAFPTDQILLARVLADRQGCFLHSSGVIFRGQGLLFAGHKGAGKSAIAKIMQNHAEILCDDRIIVRKSNGEMRVFGTWSSGDLPDTSPSSAPLRAILFLKQGNECRLEPVVNRFETVRNLLELVVKPLVTADWWEKTLLLINTIVKETPAYYLNFDLSGDVVTLLHEFVKESE